MKVLRHEILKHIMLLQEVTREQCGGFRLKMLLVVEGIRDENNTIDLGFILPMRFLHVEDICDL